MVPLNSHEFPAYSNRFGYNNSEPSKQVKKIFIRFTYPHSSPKKNFYFENPKSIIDRREDILPRESIGSKIEFPDNQNKSPDNKAQRVLSKESRIDWETGIKKEQSNKDTRGFE